MKYFAIAAALMATQFTAPANAAPGERRTDVQIRTADLDLGTSQGIAELDRRISEAVVQACGTAHYLEPRELDERDRCRAAARDRAMAVRSSTLARHVGGPALGGQASR